MKRRALIAAKIIVSTVLLLWILRRSNLDEVLTAAREAYIPLLLAAYVLNFVGILISAARWRGLLKAHGVNAPMMVLVKSVMVGVFFNNFLPSTVGGDAMRAYDSYRFTQRSGAMSSVVVDRLLGLLVLSLFALLSVPFAPQLTRQVPMLAVWVGVGGAALLALSWAIFFPPSGNLFRALLAKLPARLSRAAGDVISAFGAYRGQHAALAKAFSWSLLLQGNVVIYYVIVARALGFPVPVFDFFLIVPLALYVMMAPITVNGIGLRENVFALFFAAYGIGNADAVAYAWLVYLGGLIQGLLGGLVYAVRRVQPVNPINPVEHSAADG